MVSCLVIEVGLDFYSYWGDWIVKIFNKSFKKSGSKMIINFVLNEYFFLVKFDVFKGQVIIVDFREY